MAEKGRESDVHSRMACMGSVPGQDARSSVSTSLIAECVCARLLVLTQRVCVCTATCLTCLVPVCVCARHQVPVLVEKMVGSILAMKAAAKDDEALAKKLAVMLGRELNMLQNHAFATGMHSIVDVDDTVH